MANASSRRASAERPRLSRGERARARAEPRRASAGASLGPALIVPLANRIERLSTEAAEAGGAPTDSKVTELTQVGNRLRNVPAADSALLVVAVALMAVSRYL